MKALEDFRKAGIVGPKRTISLYEAAIGSKEQRNASDNICEHFLLLMHTCHLHVFCFACHMSFDFLSLPAVVICSH